MSIALYPGTFDPVTTGHEMVALRAACIFEKLIVAIGNNSNKQCMFSLEERLEMLRITVEGFKSVEIENVEVTSYEGLTVDFCKKNDIEYIVRGVRTNTDFSTEMAIAHANKLMNERVETVFLLSDPEDTGISSSMVKDILRNKGDISGFVPCDIRDLLYKKIQ